VGELLDVNPATIRRPRNAPLHPLPGRAPTIPSIWARCAGEPDYRRDRVVPVAVQDRGVGVLAAGRDEVVDVEALGDAASYP
jgi:hypothetical protein